MSWIQTFTDSKFDLLNPQVDQVDVRVIAHALARTCRFGGHVRQFYSVAQHSVIVSHNVPAPYALHGLMHDAAEAYIGDVVRPIKEILNQISRNAYLHFEANIEETIWRRVGIEWTEDAEAAIDEADERALSTEARDLFGKPFDNWTAKLRQKLPSKIIPVPPEAAELGFLARFVELSMGWRQPPASREVDDPSDGSEKEQPIYWFALLESARDNGDETLKGTAIQELRRLGVYVQFDRPKPPITDLAGAVTDKPHGPKPLMTQAIVREALDKSAAPQLTAAPIDDGRPLSRLAHEIRLELIAASLTREQNTTIRQRICEIYAAGELNSVEASYLQEVVALNGKRFDRAEAPA